ncbi:unnamed protein product [Closterium sp. Yama58-4]|nr:unnamed protein product [Closterium sp. Yama58-4]
MLPGISEDGPLGVAGAYDDALMASAADRQSHWGFNETKELIALRAEMERDFVPGRTSNHVWETISARMKEKGYRRSPNQCKCKWKVLVNRYKNKELSADGSRPLPFFEEVDAIFQQRARNMDRLLVQAEGGGIGSGFSAGESRAGAVGGILGMRGSFGGGLGARGGAGGVGGSLLTRRARDEEEEEEEEEEEGEDELEGELNVLRNKRRKRDFNAGARKAATGAYGAGSPAMGKGASAGAGGSAGGDAFDGSGGGDRRVALERQRAGSMQEVLEQFFVQQLRLEQEWREAIERREAERRVREGEWRSRLEALERDRAQRESMWRQMEAERAAREDERAARRDQLIIALITKLSAPPAPPPAAPAPSAPPATTPPANGTVAADQAAADAAMGGVQEPIAV